MIYALLGRSLWSTGHLSILGADTPYYSLLYPAIAGLPLSLGDLATGLLRCCRASRRCSSR